MWWMGKGSINHEESNTPEEFSVLVQVALAAVTMGFVIAM
jgi:hypothetical protein